MNNPSHPLQQGGNLPTGSEMNGEFMPASFPGYDHPQGQALGAFANQDQGRHALGIKNEDVMPARVTYGSYGVLSPMVPNRPPLTPTIPSPGVPLPDQERRTAFQPPAAYHPGLPYTPQPPIRRRRTEPTPYSVEAGPFFCPTKQLYNLYSMDRTNGYKVRIFSKVDKGFFLADNDWTCYRRNYFQVSNAFTVQGTNHPLVEPETPCLIEVDGQFHIVTHFLLGINGRVSNSEKKVELVQHTPKRDKGPQTTPMPRPIRAGGNLNMTTLCPQQNIATFERIQFKTATANNGKRRAAQQYYVLIVELHALCDNGQQYQVAVSQSAPLVVRGRSPGHYADSHERYQPLTPQAADERFYSPYGRPAPMAAPGEYGGGYYASPFGLPPHGMMGSQSAPTSPMPPAGSGPHSSVSGHFVVPTLGDAAESGVFGRGSSGSGVELGASSEASSTESPLDRLASSSSSSNRSLHPPPPSGSGDAASVSAGPPLAPHHQPHGAPLRHDPYPRKLETLGGPGGSGAGGGMDHPYAYGHQGESDSWQSYPRSIEPPHPQIHPPPSSAPYGPYPSSLSGGGLEPPPHHHHPYYRQPLNGPYHHAPQTVPHLPPLSASSANGSAPSHS
ncbi:uncharacterized protein VTP21DRAFT_346 [Calcarisporiella thermophila]|uniref:uncharacterized protein n=1 Tax=Calcarisporiella thermophila TaxID=911321 RepID=UPI0037442875